MKIFPVICMAAALAASACVKVDGSLGKGLIDKSLIYDTYTVEFPLEQIALRRADELSGYSDSKVVIGAIRDDVFGLTTRESAFTLVPVLDTIDFGTNPSALSLDLYFSADTVSCADDSQARIIQNFYVTELQEVLETAQQNASRDVAHGTDLITKGVPVYNGSGPITFNFKTEFAQKVLDAVIQTATDSVIVDRSWDEDRMKAQFKSYKQRMPGVYISCQEPVGNGGRINLFSLSCLSVSQNYYVRNDNVAYLKVRSTWHGKQKDSTFMFIPGEMEYVNEYDALANNTKFSQYAFNRTSHSIAEATPATGSILVEGGTGLKPVISAAEIQKHVLDTIAKYGGNLQNTIISKATIFLPFEMPADYRDMKYFPTVLSPTIKQSTTDSEGNVRISFAGLTDASVSSEDQGDIDRSNLQYSPDISYHLQEILKRTDLDTATDADIWLLTIHTEKVENASGSLYDNSYYQSLLYASYYNSLYGGGYGGYGYGYGGYDSYSNYYSYMLMAQMMASSQQQSYSYSTELDKDRYYRGVLCGPTSARHPYFRVSFAISKK